MTTNDLRISASSTGGGVPRPDYDVVVVGGGIAGGALATVMSRAGCSVLVLERDAAYRDRNKGECMMPWGWVDAEAMGLLPFLDAAGGFGQPEWHATSEDGETAVLPVALAREEAPGTYGIPHQVARRALTDAAAGFGADVRFAARITGIDLEGTPAVVFEHGGETHVVTTRLVVGAGGRNSFTRRTLGFELECSDETHVISAMPVRNRGDFPDIVHTGTANERVVLNVSIDAERCRLYLVSRNDHYAGEADMDRFHRRVADTYVGESRTIIESLVPDGPVSTYSGVYTSVIDPRREGVVLVGDAAGYDSPLLGQGLAMAMRDVRLVTEALLASEHWDRAIFDHYVVERLERARRLREIGLNWAELRLGSHEHQVAVRSSPAFLEIFFGVFGGFDDWDAEEFHPGMIERLTGVDSLANA